MRYGEDFYAGKAALTHKTYGNGHAYYVAADMEYAFYHDLYKRLVKEAEVKLLVKFVPEGISVNTRASDKLEYLFLQNFGRKSVAVPISEEYEVVYGEESEVIAPLKTRVLKKKLK